MIELRFILHPSWHRLPSSGDHVVAEPSTSRRSEFYKELSLATATLSRSRFRVAQEVRRNAVKYNFGYHKPSWPVTLYSVRQPGSAKMSCLVTRLHTSFETHDCKIASSIALTVLINRLSWPAR